MTFNLFYHVKNTQIRRDLAGIGYHLQNLVSSCHLKIQTHQRNKTTTNKEITHTLNNLYAVYLYLPYSQMRFYCADFHRIIESFGLERTLNIL